MYHSRMICSDHSNTIRWVEDERLNTLFERRCDQLGDQPAIVVGNEILSFAQLDARANQVARLLIEEGLRGGDRIAVLFDKSVHSYVGLLAVLKIGAAYVPLDASFPNDRLDFILEDANVRAIVSVSRYREKLAGFDLQQVFLDEFESRRRTMSEARLGMHEKVATSDRLFYVIYTSGTTGKPKGVAIEHAGICNFVKVAAEVYGIREGDRCYQGMTLAFDFHVEDLWVPLIAGGTLIAGKSDTSLFGADLHAFLLEHKITVLPCVPTLLATIEQDLPDLRILLLSGEAVPHNLVTRWHRPDRSILNAYGPTECSVSSTIRRLVPDSPVTIGKPLPTYTVVILDENKEATVSDGEIGEIGIAGVCLAIGYLNREELTKQKFVRDFLDLPNNPSKRIYRTGDLGRIGEDGELHFHGRIDTQVKIRGYRVELGEIEAVLAEFPQVAQAVVQPMETSPGTTELVAYFTRNQGFADLPAGEVVETLRRRLPAYMVPAYLEELDVIPMTSNNKADRKNLPPPRTRLSASNGDAVAPRNETERQIAEALAGIMDLKQVSVTDHFFFDLGAHSLLMARFGAAVRERLRISALSMQDIYLNPTVEKLARHVETVGTIEPARQAEPIHIPSTFDYVTCAILQLGWAIGWGMTGTFVFVLSLQWTYAAMPDLGATYLRVMGLGLALMAIACVVPIAVKWLFIGRWKADVIPVWSIRYFWFWVAKGVIAGSPIAAFGGPYYNLYLRALGAKIGKGVVIDAGIKPVCTDLLTIGDNTILRRASGILGYKAQGNLIRTGGITIGANAYVGEASTLDINTVMEDDSQLGNSSCLHSGQRIAKGKHFHGSPAVETTADYCQCEPRDCTTLRRYTYATAMVVLGSVLAPLPVLLLYFLFPYAYDFVGASQFSLDDPLASLQLIGTRMLLLSLAVYFGFFALVLFLMGTVPRLLNKLLTEDRTYVLYGFHYFVQRWIGVSTNSAYFNRVFGDSCGVVHYLRWLGYKLNRIIQTGSNFGEDQGHDNPFYVDIGTGTMVSDGLVMSSASATNSSFRLNTVRIGEANYLGNYVRYPSIGKTGTNCLLGTMTLVPVDGPIRENVGLLGSPPFEIPRAVSRDRKMSAALDEETKRTRLRAKNRYNFWTAIFFLAKEWFGYFVLACAGLAALLYYPRYRLDAVFLLGIFGFAFTLFWGWLIERASLGFGWLKPQIALVLDPYYWFHERHWHLFGLTGFASAFAGTPFKSLISRLEGVKVGKKVFDDGVRWTEYSLIEVGDYANLNVMSTVWPHSLEEGVFKSDRIKIGAGCTIHGGSLVHYGVTMGDRSVVGPGSYLMKGEILDPDSAWRGNPARAVVEPLDVAVCTSAVSAARSAEEKSPEKDPVSCASC